MEYAKIENKHRTTHRFLAGRYFKATSEKKEFYKKMMDINDCRLIEEGRAIREKKIRNDEVHEERMKTIEKKHADTHFALFKRSAANGNPGATSQKYRHLLDLNDKRMKKEIWEAFKPETDKRGHDGC